MDELIRRSDAIKSVLGITMLQGRVPIDTVIYQISSIPAVEPKQGEWIPCSERLPESDINDLEYPTVIVTLTHGEVTLACYYESTNEWGCGEDFNRKCFPIAWMPLPEPWKGADDE